MPLAESRQSNGTTYRSLVECPACGAEIKTGVSLQCHLYEDHLPEDFGLSPLRGDGS